MSPTKILAGYRLNSHRAMEQHRKGTRIYREKIVSLLNCHESQECLFICTSTFAIIATARTIDCPTSSPLRPARMLMALVPNTLSIPRKI